MAVDFGLSLLFGPPKGQLNQWLADLDASLLPLTGYIRSLWMTDHFFWDGEPTFEAWTVLSFLASAFPAFEVAPMVLGQSYRNPAMLALQAATLQTLSGGRFIMGIGAGWKEDEYRAYNYDFPRAGIRIEQLEDTLNIFKKLWTEPGQVTYVGKHYKVVDAWCEPKPDPMIPILVGGAGEKTMRLAARYADMWNLSDANITRYKERMAILQRHCDELGRDISTLRRTWFGRVAIGRTQAEAEKYASSRRIKYTTENAFVGTPEQIAEQMAEFIEVGCDYFMIDPIGLPDLDIIGLVTEELIAKVKAV
jgi:alkanesulfonate monooxygenase SsuD/methylene tetrahydromethanopterin reductase-like flavin-dependent oxidoreductase (luciferase family)